MVQQGSTSPLPLDFYCTPLTLTPGAEGSTHQYVGKYHTTPCHSRRVRIQGRVQGFPLIPNPGSSGGPSLRPGSVPLTHCRSPRASPTYWVPKDSWDKKHDQNYLDEKAEQSACCQEGLSPCAERQAGPWSLWMCEMALRTPRWAVTAIKYATTKGPVPEVAVSRCARQF